ncbi:menaquinone-dependent protoporphyrinogen oxidase [Streptomyces sp. SLBN-118]|uniref:flavodoxin domain-containing protein n=1 Tax=Streptomyces sp. SLBN-118 TaxID=2768454 RepID=UPI001150DC17|nr:flavodoxin domain-containing protein [Streptomyces sp. SLBN-118]TQK50020.1 menaquinone-dependent protoporphyrinogen oxidase [Streptomyces sp. SLBN-118]
MNARVLVAYGTKNGSTAEIAGVIADALEGEGLRSEARPAAEVRDVPEYDAVVLGGALYAGRWHRDAVRFARRHEHALAERPVWLFSSGPLDASAGERDIPPVRGAARAATLLDAREHVTFGGRLEEGARGFVARMIVKQGRGGDFRDMERIRAWARGIAKEIGEGAGPASST